MSVKKVLVSERVTSELGEEGLRELLASLWAVDCQTCGKFLGEEPPALCVDDSIVFATASLHHPGCRASQWNDSGVITHSGIDAITWNAAAGIMVLDRAGKPDPTPMMLINPGLESVVLERRQQGGWGVRPMRAFGAAGLAPSGAGRKIPGPVDGAVATTTDASLAVSFQVPGLGTYEAPADPMVVGGARACGGFLVGVTHALNPLQYEDGEFRAAMTAGKVLIGWAGAHGAVPAAPRTSRVLDATLVLHWNNHHISVGRLLGQAPKVLSSKKARAWAGRFIGTERGPLVEWMSSSSDRPQDGWFTVNALSMEQYVLRRYSDGWKLVQAYEQVIGKGVETGNEARAWAADVMQHRAGVTGLSWEPGPSTPGSSTLYARA